MGHYCRWSWDARTLGQETNSCCFVSFAPTSESSQDSSISRSPTDIQMAGWQVPTCRALSSLWFQAMLEPQDSTSFWSCLFNVACYLIWVPIGPSSLLLWVVFAHQASVFFNFLIFDLSFWGKGRGHSFLLFFLFPSRVMGPGIWSPF